MVNTNHLKKGLVLLLEGSLFEVLEYQHYKPGKGQAFVRVKVQNLENKSIIEKKLRSGEKIEDVYIHKVSMIYSYKEGKHYYFMNNETYEQIEITQEILRNYCEYLVEGLEIQVKFYQDRIVDIEMPVNVILTVSYAEQGVKGDTATSASKIAVLETGKKISVPLFVNTGDRIKVDTREGLYVERA